MSDSSLTPRRKLRLWEALALSVGLMGPTLAMSLNGAGVAGLVGNAVPLVFLAGLIGVLLIAYGFWRLTQHFNHAGSVYALAGATLGPRAGFFGGFALFGTYLFFATCTMAATGVFFQAFLDAVGVTAQVPWVLIAIATAIGVGLLNSRESIITARTLLVIEGIGIVFMLVLTVIIMARTGSAGGQVLDASLFSLDGISASVVATASVFAFLSWAGFEAAASLGEETADPKRNIPRALMGSVVLIGVLFVVVMYGQTLGFVNSPDGLEGFGSGASLTTLSLTFVGTWFGLVMAFTAFAAGFASTLSSSAAAARLLFALSRDGFGPKLLSRSHPTTHAPVNALVALLTVAVAINVVSAVSGVVAFDAYYWYATIGVLLILVVYAVAAAGAIRFIASGKPGIALWEIIIPLLGIAYLAYVFYIQAFNQVAPYSYFPGIAAVWALFGLGVVLVAPGLARRIGGSLTAELEVTHSDVDEILDQH